MRLNPLASEIRRNLEGADFNDPEYDNVLSPKWFMNPVHYEVSKLLVWMHGNNSDALVEYYIEKLNDFSKSHYELSISEPINVTFLKVELLLQSIEEFS